jgi:hypothetical protein
MMHYNTLVLMKAKLPCPEKNKGQKRTFKFAESLESKGKAELNRVWKEKPEEATFVSKKVWGKWSWVLTGEICL